MKNVGKLVESNDKLNLTSRWIDIPKEAVRPASAIEADRKEARGRVMYFDQQFQYHRNRHLRRSENGGQAKKKSR